MRRLRPHRHRPHPHPDLPVHDRLSGRPRLSGRRPPPPGRGPAAPSRSAVDLLQRHARRRHLATGIGERPWTGALRHAPLPARVRDDVVRLHEAAIDHLPGLTPDEKKARLARMSYRDYLLRVAGADPGALPFLQAMSHGGWGVGADAVGALDVWALGFPGFRGLGLAPGAAPGMGYAAAGFAGTGGSARFHFPGGNASIARLLVRRLVPGAIPGRTAEDVVAARADYARLDRPGAGVRLRLSRR